jgi:hypothetical protein
MKIYTYYEKINNHHDKYQLENIKLWKLSWEKRGFDTIILDHRNFFTSDFAHSFIYDISSIHKLITGNEISHYGLSCYNRWLAYSTISSDEDFYVSDYDVINKNFNYQKIQCHNERPAFLDYCCPCLAYGKPSYFLNFCNDIIKISKQYLDTIKQEFLNNEKSRSYHDQDFLLLNHSRAGYKLVNPGDYVCLYKHENKYIKNCKTIHVANKAVGDAMGEFEKFKNIEHEQLRIDFMKELIGY